MSDTKDASIRASGTTDVVTSDVGEGQDSDGRIKKGVSGRIALRNAKRERILRELPPCPNPQFEALWASVGEFALEGKSASDRANALDRLLSIWREHKPEELPDDPRPDDPHAGEIRYEKLPGAAQELCREMDANIGYLVFRWESGYPCTDAEALLAEYAIAVRGKGAKSRRAERLRDITIRELDAIRVKTGRKRSDGVRIGDDSVLSTDRMATEPLFLGDWEALAPVDPDD